MRWYPSNPSTAALPWTSQSRLTHSRAVETKPLTRTNECAGSAGPLEALTWWRRGGERGESKEHIYTVGKCHYTHPGVTRPSGFRIDASASFPSFRLSGAFLPKHISSTVSKFQAPSRQLNNPQTTHTPLREPCLATTLL